MGEEKIVSWNYKEINQTGWSHAANPWEQLDRWSGQFTAAKTSQMLGKMTADLVRNRNYFLFHILLDLTWRDYVYPRDRIPSLFPRHPRDSVSHQNKSAVIISFASEFLSIFPLSTPGETITSQ